VNNQERTLWDDIVELGRDLIENIDGLLNPDKQRKPAPVPVPVRNNYPPVRDPNDSNYR